MTIANFETITDMHSWCRTWPPNGSRRTRAKPKLYRKPREAFKSSWSPIGSQKSFTLKFPGIRQSLWRSLLESLHVYTTQIRDKWDCWESSAQSKGRHLCCIVAIRSEWKLVGRFYGMLHSLRNVTDLLSDGETPYERRVGQPFKGPTIPFGSLVECHPITAKNQ